jgi:acylphosphatase
MQRAKRTSRHYLISGRVQGVGYRAFAHRTAQRLGVTGWVRNLEDGSVEVLAHGSEDQFLRLEVELKQGPAHALVERLNCRIVETSEEWENFSIAPNGDGAWQSDS